MGLPDGPLVAWYGDDFTGSAAVMEEFAFAGIESVLFLKIPTADQRARFSSARCVGLAGMARAHGPAWMDDHLPAVFAFLKGQRVPLNLYKICSTLDSSPAVGSIGRALEIARPFFADGAIAVYPASPRAGRYQCFGTLFAAGQGGIYRLDRHPVVSHHPVTPMDEADIARHLAKQTKAKIGRVELPDLVSSDSAHAALARQHADGCDLVAIDTVSANDLAICGEVFWTGVDGRLIAGSQGVAEALVAYWHAEGWIGPRRDLGSLGEAKAMVAASGSLSSVSENQIAWALDHGFEGIALDTLDQPQEAETALAARAMDALGDGRTPLIYSARSRNDPAVDRFRRHAEARGLTMEAANRQIGRSLGRIVARLAADGAITRIAIAGGDTSGHVMGELGIFALTALTGTTPGAGLYLAHRNGSEKATLQIALKGGQMGSIDYFGRMRAGGGTPMPS